MTVTGEPIHGRRTGLWDAGNGGYLAGREPGGRRGLPAGPRSRCCSSSGSIGPVTRSDWSARRPSTAASRSRPTASRIVARQINQVGNRTALNLFLIDGPASVAAPVVDAARGALGSDLDGRRLADPLSLRRHPGAAGAVVEQPRGDSPGTDLSRRRLARRPLAARRSGPSRRRLRALRHGGRRHRRPTGGRRRRTAHADEASFSPDGRLIAYQSTRRAGREIYLARFPLTDERWQVSPDGGLQARWSDDGRTLYYVDLSGRLMRVTMQPTGARQRPGGPSRCSTSASVRRRSCSNSTAVHGDRFLVLRPAKDSAPQSIAVIGNWSRAAAARGRPFSMTGDSMKRREFLRVGRRRRPR